MSTARVAVITGASSVIGEATARALAADGHSVALLAAAPTASRRSPASSAMARSLSRLTSPTAARSSPRPSACRRSSAARTSLVNNAGVMLTAPFTSDQREEHRRMVETNLLGAMTVTEVFLEQLRAGHGGDLVNISSVAGRVAPSGFAAYSATKWGINGWSEALRVELQPDIRVTVIEPGAIATELSDHITHGDSKKAAKEFLNSAILPSDIADVVAFAVSRPKRVTLNEILVRPTVQAM
jgi:NADP-dependent 3-hydroxy acid dehydrogenase YdfG